MSETGKTTDRLTLRDRLKRVRPMMWVRFGVAAVLLVLLTVWVGSLWLLLLLIPLADIYLTSYIPWTLWKRSKYRWVRTLMSWVDALVYAGVLCYVLFMFVGQQYNIPSSSLEKSLLIGDYLWVKKYEYGPRIDQTPLHFPLAQHTMLGCKSYIESPQLKYHRLPGLRSVERGDIVVFNYPQGDTVCLKMPNPDYYRIVYELERGGVKDAREYIRSDKQQFGEVVWRPVDRRETYVKRAIGLPGERVKIKDAVVYIDGKPLTEPDHVQYNYIIPVKSYVADEKWRALGVNEEDWGSGPRDLDGSGMFYYDVPLTAEMLKQVEAWPEVKGKIMRENKWEKADLGGVFPLGSGWRWNRDNMGEIWIPKRGSTLHLTLQNLPMYERAIRVYEGNDLEVRDGKIYINGKQTDYYTFSMDYYWMMGDNRDRSLDSRYWGFVPEDHVVGTPALILLSVDGENGGLRFGRMLRDANPNKGNVKRND